MKVSGIAERISDRYGFPKNITSKFIHDVFNEIVAVLETDEPVVIEGFGEFYFDYSRAKKVASLNEMKDATRTLKLRLIGYTKQILNRDVASIGITSTKSKCLKEKGLSESDIPKIREEINKAMIDRDLKLKKMRGDITLSEIASNLSHIIEEMEPDNGSNTR